MKDLDAGNSCRYSCLHLPISPIDLPFQIRPHNPLQTHPRCIDGTFAGVNENIIQKAAKSTANKRCHDGHPEIIVPCCPHFRSVPDNIAHEPRSKVPRKVHRVARLEPKTGAQSPDQEEQADGKDLDVAHWPRVAHILQREDAEHQHRRLDDFGPELRVCRHEGLRVRAEYARGGGLGGGHGAVPNALVRVDRVVVVPVHDARGEEASQELREEVDREPPPREAAVEAVAECDRRVEVAARVAGDVDSQHHAEGPSVSRQYRDSPLTSQHGFLTPRRYSGKRHSRSRRARRRRPPSSGSAALAPRSRFRRRPLPLFPRTRRKAPAESFGRDSIVALDGDARRAFRQWEVALSNPAGLGSGEPAPIPQSIGRCRPCRGGPDGRRAPWRRVYVRHGMSRTMLGLGVGGCWPCLLLTAYASYIASK